MVMAMITLNMPMVMALFALMVVGGAVGAGVGGAMGAVKGVFGINDRGYRCRGYYDHYDRFHCYR